MIASKVFGYATEHPAYPVKFSCSEKQFTDIWPTVYSDGDFGGVSKVDDSD